MSKILNYLSNKIDSTGMYRTVTVSLIFLVVTSHVFGLFKIIPYTFFEQLISVATALSVAIFLSYLIGRTFKIPVNIESAVITALIIFFLVLPAQITSLSDTWIIVFVTTIAIISKFLIAIRKQHILNPAAAGAVGLTVIYTLFPSLGHFESSWWIGSVQMFVPLLIAGVVVVLKIKKRTPVLAFLSVGFLVFLFEEWQFGGDLISGASRYWMSGPSLFLAFFMLTEPFTMPPTKKMQLWYGVLVGFLSQTTVLSGILRMIPELALVIGNIVFFGSTLKQKLYLEFVSVKEIAKNTFEFTFKKPQGMNFVAGQYLEWMIPHKKSDNRGIRRYFTIVSAPSDPELKMSVRIGEQRSTFKSKLKQLQSGEIVIASQLAGDFVLPRDQNVKIAMVAGGIGITPFISHLKELEYQNQRRDVVLYSCNNTQADAAYRPELIEISDRVGLKYVDVLAKEQVLGAQSGFLSKEIIQETCPDFKERVWYISGPPVMVNSYKHLLRKIGVAKRKIKTDYFSGLA
jgi:ferredoxin-NADP reductase/Na+-translocating ferredoxin:NAD+ oxidoreductase RnfD subunit